MIFSYLSGLILILSFLDYNIKIPRIVRENIAEIIEVSVKIQINKRK